VRRRRLQRQASRHIAFYLFAGLQVGASHSEVNLRASHLRASHSCSPARHNALCIVTLARAGVSRQAHHVAVHTDLEASLKYVIHAHLLRLTQRRPAIVQTALAGRASARTKFLQMSAGVTRRGCGSALQLCTDRAGLRWPRRCG
jgi:hypothetical protein